MNHVKRIEWLDIYKGIAILLIVIGHLSIGISIKNFIYSFHVPLFLFASGLVRKKRNRFQEFIKRDILKLFYAYMFFSTLWMVFDLLWGKLIIMDTKSTSYSFWQYPLTLILGNGNITGISIGAQWYLSMVLAIKLLYEVISYISNDYLRSVLIIVAFAGGGILFNGNASLPWCISQALTGIIFFWIGDSFRTQILRFAVMYRQMKWCRVFFPLVCYIVVFLIGGVNSMSQNKYDSCAIFFITSLIGAIGTMALSIDIDCLRNIKKAFIFYGEKSLYVMGWHSEIRVVFIYLIGSVVRSGLIKNGIVLFLSLILCIPLCYVSEFILKPRHSAKKINSS